MSTEPEVKFYLPDLPALRERVLVAGGALHAPRALETNLRFDDPAGSLTPARRVLRLRQDRRARLTYKAPGAVRDGVHQRTEHEVEVSDFETARAILEALGYRVSWTYEKYRETFHLGAVEVALDELPLGNFAELEGPDAPAIRAAARTLELNWRARYTGSYTALFAVARRTLGLTFADLTFANFRDLTVTPADLGLEGL